MPATTQVPLGPSTTNRKWRVDVDLNDGVGTPSWIPVAGITNCVPNFDNANFEDDSDYDSGGAGSQTKTSYSWSVALTVGRKGTAADVTAYDPGQEKLRAKAEFKTGIQNSVYVRVYEMEPGGPRVLAYTGKAGVTFQEQGGANNGLSTAQITLNGQGAAASIAHPDTGSAVPTIGSVTVAGATALTIPAAGGSMVRLVGSHFLGTTGITFAGTNAPNFIVDSDGVIHVNAPAHAAGSGNLVVTNGAGPSAGYPITFV